MEKCVQEAEVSFFRKANYSGTVQHQIMFINLSVYVLLVRIHNRLHDRQNFPPPMSKRITGYFIFKLNYMDRGKK